MLKDTHKGWQKKRERCSSVTKDFVAKTKMLCSPPPTSVVSSKLLQIERFEHLIHEFDDYNLPLEEEEEEEEKQ